MKLLMVTLLMCAAPSLRAAPDRSVSTPSFTFDEEYGPEYEPGRDHHDRQVIGGPRLVYDCQQLRWTCVIPRQHRECADRRGQEIAQGKHHLSCVPGETYPSKGACREDLLRLVARGNVPRSCLHPTQRPRLIGFR